MTAGPWTFEVVGPALSANGRLHWRATAARTAQWRERAGWHCRAARIPRLARGHVLCEWVPGDARRRDPANCAPAAKACVDGMVDAGVFDDDDAGRVEGPDCRLAGPWAVPSGLWRLRFTVTDMGDGSGT